MFFEDREIRSVSDLPRLLAELNIQEVTWFRGHASVEWKLIPSLGRPADGLAAEVAIIKRFKQNAGPFLTTNLTANRPVKGFEWLMLMQHYRAPTRLLDWSESPLVALFFAVESQSHWDDDGYLWCLLPVRLNAHSNIKFQFAAELPLLGDDEVVDNYSPERIEAERRTDLAPLAVIGPRDSPRMYAQLGTFTITHRDQIAVEDVGDASHIGRFRIPADAKQAITSELEILKITKLTLFPELENVAELAREVLP